MAKISCFVFIISFLMLSACVKDKKEIVAPAPESKEQPRPKPEKTDPENSGEKYNPKDPKRVKPQKNKPPTCKAGEIIVDGECKPKPPTCKAGEIIVDGECKPKPPTCKADEVIVDGKCKPKPTPEDPFKEANAEDDEICRLKLAVDRGKIKKKDLPEDMRKKISIKRFKQSQCLYHRVAIPNAKCANGDPYHIYMSKNALETEVGERSKKVRFIFQGGGACWSKESCCLKGEACNGKASARIYAAHPYMPDPQYPKIESFHAEAKGLNGKKSKNTFADHSLVLFPYCTGDVFLGQHEANYDGKKVLHSGVDVIKKSLAHIRKKELIQFDRVESAVVYGFSAGAIGALYHVPNLDDELPKSSNKTLIADAPGLHYGPTFWHKFPEKYFKDISEGLKKAYNYTIDKDEGVIADVLEKACSMYQNWKFAVIQADKDNIMSEIFGGGKTPAEVHTLEAHKEQVNNHPKGLYSVMKRDEEDNCIGFIGNGHGQHTLMVANIFAAEQAFDGDRTKTLLKLTKKVAFEGFKKTINAEYKDIIRRRPKKAPPIKTEEKPAANLLMSSMTETQ